MGVGLLSAAALFGVTPAHGQRPEAPVPAAEQELRALDKAWAQAEIGHDKAALEQLLDTGFVATWASGKTVDRSAFIEAIMRTALDSSAKSVVDAVHVHGDVGVVIERFGTTSLDTKVTWVAIKNGGRWRVVAEQMTKLATPAGGRDSVEIVWTTMLTGSHVLLVGADTLKGTIRDFSDVVAVDRAGRPRPTPAPRRILVYKTACPR